MEIVDIKTYLIAFNVTQIVMFVHFTYVFLTVFIFFHNKTQQTISVTVVYVIYSTV